MKSRKALPAGTKKKLKDQPKRKGVVGLPPQQVGVSAVVDQEGNTRRRVERPGMKLTQQQLEAHLWGAANILRGKTAGQDYKNYILSLMFYKRLCDQWENEADEAILEQERQQGRPFTEKQKAVFRARGGTPIQDPRGQPLG